jgi:hypothetical protein
VFREGEAHRKQRQFDRAEARYTEALELDPRFVPAYARRGQVRLVRRAVAAAIADFSAALALDDSAVQAWWWRGDAHALNGQLDEAIADYTRALELCPELDRARFNRAVAERRKRETATVPAPVSTPEVHPAIASDPTVPAPEISSESPDPPAHVATRLVTADRKGGQLVVDCPHCSAVGEVPWTRLGAVFACKSCGRRFGISTEGKAVEVTEAPGGKWVEAGKARAHTRHRRTRRMVVVGVVVAAVLFPALGFAGWRAVWQVEDAPREVELPKELQARAEVFARGWLTNDVRLMQRLTSTTHDKVLFSWYTRHRPPLTLRGATPTPEGTRIEVALQTTKVGHASVRVRVSNSTTAPGQPPVELVLAWEERADGWYFVPPAK